jgi:endonuclease YncB( thermonuclease family)
MKRLWGRLQEGVWRSLLLLFVWQADVGAQELVATVVKVFDGDSFIVKPAADREIEVRLQEIDAPEKNQPHADKARSALRGLIYRKRLRLVIDDTDRYGRKVARAYRIEDGLDINAEMVKRGHAWVYRRHARDQSLFIWEQQARQQKRGLWALAEAQRTPPWQWRRDHPRKEMPGAALRTGS